MDEQLTLVEKLKRHIEWEEGMEESMLSFYISNAKRYVNNATGHEPEYVVLQVASIMWEYRVSEQELQRALDAITPFIVQEALCGGETTDEST